MSTGIASISAVIVVGFTFLATFNLSRFWLLRQSGYLIFFAVVTSGYLVAFYLAATIAYIPSFFGVGDGTTGKVLLLFTQSQPSVLAISIVITFVIGVLCNRSCTRENAAKIVSRHNGDLIEVLLQESIETPSMVKIDLSSGKSYIGYPVESGITTLNASDITVIPTLSGFRESETKKLKITTKYDGIIDHARRSTDNENQTSFTLVLPKDQIVAVRKFDLEIFMRFQEKGDDPSS